MAWEHLVARKFARIRREPPVQDHTSGLNPPYEECPSYRRTVGILTGKELRRQQYPGLRCRMFTLLGFVTNSGNFQRRPRPEWSLSQLSTIHQKNVEQL